MTQGSPPALLPDLGTSEAAALLRRGVAVLLVVRQPEERAAGHAPWAALLLRGRGTLVAVPQVQPVLTGDMKAWAQAGLPDVTGDGDPGTVA